MDQGKPVCPPLETRGRASHTTSSLSIRPRELDFVLCNKIASIRLKIFRTFHGSPRLSHPRTRCVAPIRHLEAKGLLKLKAALLTNTAKPQHQHRQLESLQSANRQIFGAKTLCRKTAQLCISKPAFINIARVSFLSTTTTFPIYRSYMCTDLRSSGNTALLALRAEWPSARWAIDRGRVLCPRPLQSSTHPLTHPIILILMLRIGFPPTAPHPPMRPFPPRHRTAPLGRGLSSITAENLAAT